MMFICDIIEFPKLFCTFANNKVCHELRLYDYEEEIDKSYPNYDGCLDGGLVWQ